MRAGREGGSPEAQAEPPHPSWWSRLSAQGPITAAWKVAGLLLGLVLVVAIAALVVVQYRSRAGLRDAQLGLQAQGLERRATAVQTFLLERVENLMALAEGREVRTYYENLALGMSREYGLAASLHAVEDRFDAVRDRERLGGGVVFERIVLLDEGGDFLATSGIPVPPEGSGPWHRVFHEDGGLPIHADRSGEEPRLVLSARVTFKERVVAHVVAWLPLSVLYRGLAADRLEGSTTAVALGPEYLLLPRKAREAATPELRVRPAAIAPGAAVRFGVPGGTAVFVFRAPVRGTPLSLVGFVPATSEYELHFPFLLLVVTVGMAVALVAGTALLVDQSTRNSALVIRLEETSLRERTVEEKNRQLEAEVRERRHAEEALRTSESRHAALLAAIPDIMFLQSADGRFLDFYASSRDRLLVPPERFLGRSMAEVLPGPVADRFTRAFEKALQTGGPEVVEYTFDTSQGEQHFEARVVRCADERLLSIVRDVTESRNARAELVEKQRRLDHLAHHDPLTGLPNRLLFQDRFQTAIARARRSHGTATLLFVDLDRFKNVNDTVGHMVGDQLLRLASERLLACIREVDTVARLGGDEFTIVIEGAGDEEASAVVARKVIDALAAPFRIGGHELFVGASVGITTYPRDGSDVETLMRSADAALYHAKGSGRGTFRFFTDELDRRAQQTLAREVSLRYAIERGQLALHYQPQVDALTGRVAGVEALLRWSTPELGPVSPSEFIPLAEETGLIVPIGAWALRAACGQTAAWHRAGSPGLRVGVNLSARQFRQADLVDSVLATLRETGLPPGCLDLELTESVLLQDVPAAVETLAALKRAGVRISIDDFGVGFSSLSYLKRLPIDCLKVAQEFVRDLLTEPHDASIATAIVSLGRALDLDVIAEGVETREHLDFFLSLGCATLQGYFFSRPLPAEQVGELLRGPGFGAQE